MATNSFDKVAKETNKQLEQIEKDIKLIYQKAQKEIKEKLFQQGQNVKSLPSTATQAERLAEWNKYNRLQALEGQITTILSDTTDEAVKAFNGYLGGVYQNNYNYSAYRIETIAGRIGAFPLLDKRGINLLAQEKISPFTLISVRKYKNKADILRTLQVELLSGISQGESIEDLSRRMAKVTGKKYNDVVVMARTETTRIESAGRFDAMEYGQNKLGIEQEKEWIASSGDRTRKSHRRLDGTIVPLDGYFKIGSDKARYPGDFSKPENTINCRCTVVTNLVGFEDGEPDISYEDWQEEREKAIRKQKQSEKNKGG